ncbi:MAG: ABC transporter substrate-binding protein [Rhodobacterales bacterium]|nr:ABC transporter substrate-binding protein [Rhodobacterales bacterium]
MTTRLTAKIAASTVLTSVLALPALAENIPVTYGTNWVAQAEHGGFYQAVADGTYAECGLDVTIVPGGPQVNNAALLLAGRIDFYMGGTVDGFFAVQEGLPLVNVAAMFQKDPQILLTHPGTAATFSDIQKLPTILISDGGYAGFYQWMMSAYGFTEEQRVPYTFNAAPFIADPQSAMQGYLSSEPAVVEKEGGFTPDVWLLADAGYTSYSTTIQTLADTVANKPDIVQCFVDGSIKGWYNYIYNDNTAANALIMADNPDMTQELIDYAIDKMKAYGIVDSGDTLTLGVGAMTDERMADFYTKMVASGLIPDGLDIKASYTTQFINKGVGLDLKPAQ